jgi:hypothetical protein
MKYRSLTLVLAYCFAALGTAHTESGFLGNLDCDGARDVYPLPVGNGGENNAIFDEMRDAEEPNMCRHEQTCCSKSAEQDLSAMSVDDVKERVSDLWNEAISPCNVSLFKDALKAYIQESKDLLIILLNDTFHRFFTRYSLFDEFYNYTQQAIDTGNACRISYKFNKLFYEVFLAILEADPAVDTSVYPNNDTFNICLYRYYLELNSEDVHKRFLAFTRSFNRTLYYIRALNTAQEFINEVMALDYSPQCQQAIMKATYCAQCSGYPSTVATCAGLCLNTLRGCLIDFVDLYEPFRRFTTAVIRMKEYLDGNVNLFNHIGLLTTGFFDVITTTQRMSRTINEEILVRCVSNNRGRREADSEAQASQSRISRSIFPRSTVAPPSNVFNNSAYCMLKVAPLFKTVPDTICDAHTEAPNSQACWNGNSVGSYDREVINFNRTAQEDNPELIVCQRLPKALRVQVGHLERVTQEINIISRSHTCPEDDEDCSVDEQRCDYNAQRPVSILVDNTFDMERDGEGNTEYGTGYGSGYSSGYSGVWSGSGSGVGSGEEEEEELDACLADPLVSPSVPTPTPSVSLTTTPTPTTEPTIEEPTKEEPSDKPPSSLTPSPTKEPTKEPPKGTEPTASALSLCVPSISALFAALLAASVVLQVVL